MLRGQAALAGARKTWRIGLIGAGRWGQVYIRTLAALGDRCQLTHVASRRPETRERLGPSVAVVADWREVVHAECDAIIIATPPAMHAEMLEACLEAGKPCIVEKPLCVDVATAERLHARVEEAGIPVLVDHTHLFSVHYRALKRAVASSGAPIRAILTEGMAFGPFREGTPVLWDWGPHDVSLCLDLMGRMPDDVQALAGPRAPHGDAELISVRLTFPSGACAWVQIGCLSPQKRRRLTVSTDQAVYVWDDLAEQRLAVAQAGLAGRYAARHDPTLQWTPILVESETPPLTNMLRYFVEGLEGGDRTYFGSRLASDVVHVLSQCHVERGRHVPSSWLRTR